MDLKENLCDGQLCLGVKYFLAFVCLYVCLSVCICVCPHQVFFAHKSWTDGWIMMILASIIDMDETLKLIQDQGHKVKGQGHIAIYVKKWFGL